MSESQAIAEHATKATGTARWVQIAFMAIWMLLVWVLDRSIRLVWRQFAEPVDAVATLSAIVVGAAIAMALYRNASVHRHSHEIVGELTKVSWPSRAETQVSTVVVIVASLVAALIVGIFDAAWSKLTDLIY